MPYITSIEQMAIEKGKAEGRAEGRAEEQQTIALNMLRREMAIEIVAELTGLSVEQVEQLRTQLQAS